MEQMLTSGRSRRVKTTNIISKDDEQNSTHSKGKRRRPVKVEVNELFDLQALESIQRVFRGFLNPYTDVLKSIRDKSEINSLVHDKMPQNDPKTRSCPL